MIESVEEFLALTDDESPAAMERIRLDSAPEEVWGQILDLYPELARTVTLNKTLPEGILLRLAGHDDASVRADVANVRRLPRAAFEALVEDQDESVRARLAWNKKIPPDILERLADDEEPIVSNPARSRLGR